MRELALIEAIAAALQRRDGGRIERWLGDDGTFDPDKYEAPPQPPPTGGDGGGTQAPG